MTRAMRFSSSSEQTIPPHMRIRENYDRVIPRQGRAAVEDVAGSYEATRTSESKCLSR